jgi:hypothetical protein
MHMTLSLGVKRTEREADHVYITGIEIMNAWSYIATPQYIFMEWYLVKQADKFT